MTTSDTTRGQLEAEHLAQVQTLLRAITAAISAIENNDLRGFEGHLAEQETACNRLAASPVTLLFEQAANGAGDGEPLFGEIRAAHAALARLNRVYAAVLKRARRSTALMAALYRNHLPSPRCHTWSCEV